MGGVKTSCAFRVTAHRVAVSPTGQSGWHRESREMSDTWRLQLRLAASFLTGTVLPACSDRSITTRYRWDSAQSSVSWIAIHDFDLSRSHHQCAGQADA